MKCNSSYEGFELWLWEISYKWKQMLVNFKYVWEYESRKWGDTRERILMKFNP